MRIAKFLQKLMNLMKKRKCHLIIQMKILRNLIIINNQKIKVNYQIYQMKINQGIIMEKIRLRKIL